MKLLVLIALFMVGGWGEEKPIRLGFMPYLSAEAITEKYTPLADYLSKKLGQKVEIFISSSYAEHTEKTARDEICISFLGGSPYVEIVDSRGPKPLLARFEFDHKTTLRSVIFVPKDSPLKTLSELKGKRFAFGSPNSTLSAQVPLYMLLRSGVKLSDLGGYAFLNNHENVYFGVHFDDFHAGAVAEELFEGGEMAGVRALAYSEPFSTHLFVARSNLPAQTQETIRQALFDLNKNPQHDGILKAINKSLTGFAPVSDSDYDRHRVMLKTVKPALDKP